MACDFEALIGVLGPVGRSSYLRVIMGHHTHTMYKLLLSFEAAVVAALSLVAIYSSC